MDLRWPVNWDGLREEPHPRIYRWLQIAAFLDECGVTSKPSSALVSRPERVLTFNIEEQEALIKDRPDEVGR